ncbi:MAG: SMC-Scp complex subunit ScpB [Clostridiales bacterium]|nr:SMC-Scp complex subunit ScpB [Clostridiales bacterium]
MNKDELKGIIEALLFAWSEPLSIKELCKLIDVDKDEVEISINEMSDEFSYEKRGLQIIKMEEYYQLATKPKHHEYIKSLLEPKQKKGLTRATLETLSIIAYKQPVTKVEVESIRGVKCDKSIHTLQEKGLVEERGRLEKTGRPILYGTNIYFLKMFGLTSLEELPEINELDLLTETENEVKDIFSR